MDDALNRLIFQTAKDYERIIEPIKSFTDQIKSIQDIVKISIPDFPKIDMSAISAAVEAQRFFSEYISKTYQFSKSFSDEVTRIITNITLATASFKSIDLGLPKALIDSLGSYAETSQTNVDVPLTSGSVESTFGQEFDLKTMLEGLNKKIDDLQIDITEMREETGVLDKQNKWLAIILAIISLAYSILTSDGSGSASGDIDKQKLQSDIHQIIETHYPDNDMRSLDLSGGEQG